MIQLKSVLVDYTMIYKCKGGCIYLQHRAVFLQSGPVSSSCEVLTPFGQQIIQPLPVLQRPFLQHRVGKHQALRPNGRCVKVKYKWRVNIVKKERRPQLYRKNLITVHSNAEKKTNPRSGHLKNTLKIGRGDLIKHSKGTWVIYWWSVCTTGEEGTRPPRHRLWKLIPQALSWPVRSAIKKFQRSYDS